MDVRAPIRNIDFDALRSLRDRHGAAYPRGRVIFRQGDTSAEFYVVLQGSVELSIRDENGQKKVLFISPPGDFFGEMSCFGGQPRSATATANEDNTVLLQFTQESAIQLLRASPRFTLGVIQRLCDRVNNANGVIADLNAQLAQAGQAQTGGKTSIAMEVSADTLVTAAAAAKPPAEGDDREAVAQALERHVAALRSGLARDPAGELSLLLVLGELSLADRKPAESAKWLARAAQHPELRKKPDLQRLIRERWTQAREEVRAKS